MAKRSLLDDVVSEAPNRRSFLGKIAMAGAAAAAVHGTAQLADAQAITDVDIVQFALNLEYLEAEFYTLGTTGRTIAQLGIGITGTGTAGETTGGKQVTFANNTILTSDVANQIAADERAHVTLLRGALTAAGAMPVAKPAIKLDALGIGFNSMTEFLILARAFEDVGVTAYAGAAPLIQNRDILGAAARILAAEAEHAANIRLQVARLGISTSLLDGVDVLPPPSGRFFFSVDSNGLVAVRTPGQVLNIVYGGAANATSGGFYPNGMNGNIRMSSAGVAITGTTAANVTPMSQTTSATSVVLDASASTSASGALTYLYSVAPGGLVPAILQSPTNPRATIQFVNGAGTYMVNLVVRDMAGNSSTQMITLVFQPAAA